MQNFSTYLRLLCIVLFSGLLAACVTQKAKISLKDRLDLAIAQEIEMTKDPALGYVPKDRLLDAIAWKKKMEIEDSRAAISNFTWKELGPANVSGRTRTICIDANDPTGRTIWAGSVGGGLWKTTDITAASPNWTPSNDLFENLAVTTIAQDPSNANILYFGTGEGTGNGDAIRGFGVWRSANGGSTWAQLASTTNSNFNFCQKIAITNTGVVLVATITGGLRRSTNGGTTFTKVLGTALGITGANSNVCWDVEVAANGDIYAALAGSIHKSTDGGATFGAAMTLPITAGRIDLACAPSNAACVYALIEQSSVVNGIIRTLDGGTTWTSRSEPNDADTGIADTDFSRGQAWFDLTIAVDPNNANVLMTGGINLFKSSDGANTWTQISHWYGGFGEQYVHADQHYIIYRPGSSTEVYFANDGGVYRSSNGGAVNPTIAFKGDNYNVTQLYACAMHPNAQTSYFLAGSQDNGTQKFQQNVIQNTTEATGGDGAFCHIDQNQPQFQITSYVYNSYYRSANNGASWTGVTHSGSEGRFINPTDYDDVSNLLYCARANNQYARWDNPQTGSTFNVITATAFGGRVSAIKVSPNTNNRVFFGIGIGKVVRVDNANTATPTFTDISTGLPASYISCVEVETGNDNHLLVTYSNYGVNSIWESLNGGTSWTSVEGNLPDMPIRWALFNPNNSDQAVIATELGTWSTDNLNGGSTNWGASNSGFANVRVDMLQLRASDKVIIAATHGRGLFWSDVFTDPTANFTADKKTTYQNTTIQFSDISYKSTAWSWNFGDGTTSTLQHPTHSYTTAGLYDVSLIINAGASAITKTGFIQILPDKGTPYAIADGGNFEVNPLHFGANIASGTTWQRGASAVAGKSGTVSGTNVWVTGLTGNYVNNSISQLWTPNYNFSASGSYTLSFSAKYNTEVDYDGFRVEYSLDRGTTWFPIGTTTATGWYNFANTNGDASFPVNEAFFAGNFGAAFTNYTRDISFLAGNANVAFRFAFRSDGSLVGPGIAIDNFAISSPFNPVLPVASLNFTASKEESAVNLAWNTQKEVNVSHYALERSTDMANFGEIAELKARGGDENSYHHTDKLDFFDLSAQNWLYYRLKVIDIDNSFVYSSPQKVYLGDMQPQKMSISPNPFTDYLQLSANSQILQVLLFDTNGKLVHQENNINQTIFKLYFPQKLAKGNYLLKVIRQDKTESVPVICE
ncbi:MAG: PKD domain-containing protein [Bacteroidia bacterium]